MLDPDPPQRHPAAPVSANGYCGAHKAGYFEAHYPMPNAYRTQNIVVGASNAETEHINLSQPCGAMLSTNCVMPADSYNNKLSEDFAHCLAKSPSIQEMRKSLKVSVLIFTAPSEQVIPDMLYPPDVVSGGSIKTK
ncbi:hypothetical protein [Streptomyces sp. NPDC050485]|uniref:hypothetical protein n=1 Tax=Streptomyces sp. NPDC050485 TaxID=3365617 RepID=UPI0037A27D45